MEGVGHTRESPAAAVRTLSWLSSSSLRGARPAARQPCRPPALPPPHPHRSAAVALHCPWAHLQKPSSPLVGDGPILDVGSVPSRSPAFLPDCCSQSNARVRITGQNGSYKWRAWMGHATKGHWPAGALRRRVRCLPKRNYQPRFSPAGQIREGRLLFGAGPAGMPICSL